MAPKFKNIGGQMVCGALRSGGQVKKSGVYRLHKGEKVFSTNELNKACKCSHAGAATKKKGKKGATKHSKCKCKH